MGSGTRDTARRFANDPVRLASDPAPVYVGACVLLLFDKPESGSDVAFAVNVITRYAQRVGLRVTCTHLTPTGDRSIYDQFNAETHSASRATNAAGATMEHQADPGSAPDPVPGE
jgi:hypothetical protein